MTGQNAHSRTAGERLSSWVYALAGLKLMLHLMTANHYPLHRDELYYIACGRHLAWAFPDHPPLVPWLAWLSDQFSGVAPLGFRIWPALAGAALVWIAGHLAWRFGGGRLAQGLAAGAMIVSPLFLLSNSMLQTVSLDQLVWATSAVVLAAVLDGSNPKWLVVFGLVLGLGTLAKLTVLAWGFALLVGLVFTRDRCLLRTPWIWLGAFAALLCALPVLNWQLTHDWPLLKFMAANRADDPTTLPGFLGQNAGMSGPLMGTLLLLAGFVFLMRSSKAGQWNSLGIAVLVVWGLMLAVGGKAYYVGPTFPLLYAGGAVLCERWLRTRPAGYRRWAVGLLASHVLMLPFFLPVLPATILEPMFNRLPHDDWRNMFGWKEVAAQTAELYQNLAPEERVGLRVLTSNYGLAGAIDWYGPAQGLPAALSGHNGYAFWEVAPALDPVIVLGYDTEWFRQHYRVVRELGTIQGSSAVRMDETGDPILYCSGLLDTADVVWRSLRHFD